MEQYLSDYLEKLQEISKQHPNIKVTAGDPKLTSSGLHVDLGTGSAEQYTQGWEAGAAAMRAKNRNEYE